MTRMALGFQWHVDDHDIRMVEHLRELLRFDDQGQQVGFRGGRV